MSTLRCLQCGQDLPGNPPQCPYCGSLGPSIEVEPEPPLPHNAPEVSHPNGECS